MENLLIYYVNIGKWITCDFSFLNKTVSEFQLQIEKKTNIPVDKQVLIVSGGGHLDPSKAISCYCAGTDTNPFFLFSKDLIVNPSPPSAYYDYRTDIDFTNNHSKTQGMSATIEALNVRVTLSQQYNENSQYNLKCISVLDCDHHRMYSGWFAAVANMYDTVEHFKHKAKIFETFFRDYLNGRDDCMNLLNNVENILSDISKIPMLPPLLGSNFKDLQNNCSNEKSLLEWIIANQGLSNLEQIVQHSENSLKDYNETILNKVLAEVLDINEKASITEHSRIKGFEPRLSKLKELVHESKCLAKEQFNISESIKMNHMKAINENDKSVISVLLASHDKQLEMMKKNNSRLLDIRNRFFKSKQEFCDNIHTRLQFLIDIEDRVSTSEAVMLLYSDNIRLIREYIDVIKQLQNTPKLYFNAVVEVVRRRIYSQALLIWSSELACHMMACHSDEIAKRKNFQSQFEGHFLSPLFPGLEDLPPAFATKAPSTFDHYLPKLCIEDLDFLTKQAPQIACITSVPNFNTIPDFFLSNSLQLNGTLAINHDKNESVAVMNINNEMMDSIEEKLNEVIRTNVGFKSCQMEVQQKSVVIKTTNLESLQSITRVSIESLRSELNLLKHFYIQKNLEIDALLSELQSKFSVQVHQLVKDFEETTQKLKLRINILESELEIHINNEEKERDMRLRMEKEKDYEHNLRIKMEDDKNKFIQEELNRARTEIKNQLSIVHKAEIEKLQARFKTVTNGANMERSLSELSLEKSKRCEVIDLINHETMMAQLKEDMLLDKEKAIQIERDYYEQLLRERQVKCDEPKDVQCFLNNSKNTSNDNKPLKVVLEKSILDLKSSVNQKDKSDSISVQEWGFMESQASGVVFESNKSSSSETEENKVSVHSCNVGDTVLVVWDNTYKNYVVYQENGKHLVFLHPHSIESLSKNLVSDEKQKILNFSAEILEKEYCSAKQGCNRYNVKKGMKFYRVKIHQIKIPLNSQDLSVSGSSSDQTTTSADNSMLM